jgi:glycine/D-amino acid oxidase-like deaminating enzyme
MWDFVVVGAGLAGTVLADKLLRAGAQVKVIDRDAGAYGSKVAGGIFNPVTGRRMVKSWMSDIFSKEAYAYYRQRGEGLGLHLLDHLDMQRLFHNEGQRQEWLVRVDFDKLQGIMAGDIAPDVEDKVLCREFGGVRTSGSWRLHTARFMDALHLEWTANGILEHRALSYNEIQCGPQGLSVAGEKSRKLVFCEGWQMVDNPWFAHLPLRPNKGETLGVRLHGKGPDEMVLKQVYLLPQPNGSYRVGATYDRDNLELHPSAEARSWLLERLQQLIKLPLEVETHKVGIRPASIDRRPMLGSSKMEPQLFVFNGFGSKGVSQVPWCAEQMAVHLLQGVPLPPEVDISRFERA